MSVGSHHKNEFTWTNIISTSVHSGFGATWKLENDIALLELATTLKWNETVQPLRPSAYEPYWNQSCNVTGWGLGKIFYLK